MKSSKTYSYFLFLFISFLTVSCLPDTLLPPLPVEGSIVRMKVTNIDGAVVNINSNNINISLPIGADPTAVKTEIIGALGTTVVGFKLANQETVPYEPGQAVDFSGDVIVQVKGTDNAIVEYFIKTRVEEVQPGFSNIELLFERKHSDYGWPEHQVYSSATSGNHVLVARSGNIDVLDAMTGASVKLLAGYPGTIHQITNDDAGRILACNVITTAGKFRIYKWENANSPGPEILLEYDVPSADIGSGVGRNLLNVTGDIEKDAVIYIPVVNKDYFFRWVIKDGEFVSTTPDKITYFFPLAQKAFSNVINNVNALGNSPEDGYIVTAEARGWNYITPEKTYTFSSNDGVLPYRSIVFDFNGAKYYAGATKTPATTFYIFDITKPEGIEMNKDQRFEAEITDFKPFQSPSFPKSTPNNNVSPHLGFSFKQNEDGTAILYYLYANSGLRAYKLTPKPNR